MKFNSATDEVKHYISELFADNKEHSRSEMIEYVRTHSDKDDYSEGNYSGAINGLVRSNQIEAVRRGIYHITESSFTEKMPLNEQCQIILNAAMTSLQHTANQVDVLKMTDTDQQTIQVIKKAIEELSNIGKLFDNK